MSDSNVKDKVWTDEEKIAEQRKCVELHRSFENSQQIDRIVPETFAKQGIYYQLAPGLVDYQGPEGVNEFYENLVKVLPDLHVEFSHEYDLPGYSIREGVFTGTHSAEFLGVPASGRTIGCPFCALYVFRDDDPTMMIAERVYWDNVDLQKQMLGEVEMSKVLPWDNTL